jgi:hypothetical protein
MLFFSWLRSCVRNAVLGGVQDALEHLNATAAEQSPKTIEQVLGALQRPLLSNGEPRRKAVRS